MKKKTPLTSSVDQAKSDLQDQSKSREYLKTKVHYMSQIKQVAQLRGSKYTSKLILWIFELFDYFSSSLLSCHPYSYSAFHRSQDLPISTNTNKTKCKLSPTIVPTKSSSTLHLLSEKNLNFDDQQIHTAETRVKSNDWSQGSLLKVEI